VDSENYWPAHLVGSAREISGNIIRIGEVVMLTGMLMVLLSLTAGAYGFQIDVLQPSTVGAVGYALAIAGGANIALGGVLKWGFLVESRTSLARCERGSPSLSGSSRSSVQSAGMMIPTVSIYISHGLA